MCKWKLTRSSLVYCETSKGTSIGCCVCINKKNVNLLKTQDDATICCYYKHQEHNIELDLEDSC